MHSELQAHLAFHLTGKKTGDGVDGIEQLGLRPALLANYRDLARLRYDYPVVLAHDDAGDAVVRSLSSVMDDLVRGLAEPGSDGERLTKHVLRLEQEIRGAVAKGASGTLGALWDAAAKRLAATGDQQFAENLRRARSALTVDGEMLDCVKDTPTRLLTHLWQGVQQRKSRQFGTVLQRLTLKLADMLKADHARSDAGLSAKSLAATVGTIHHEAIDFDMMSKVLMKVRVRTSLPAKQRARIEQSLSVLKTQRFFASAASDAAARYGFIFDSCEKAMQTYRDRLPEMTALAKAMAIAELETDGLYQESKHDALFAGFGEDLLDAQDAALFPDYLVCVNAGKMGAAESAQLMETLAEGLPVKVLVQSDDLLADSPLANRRPAGGVGPARLARMALEVDDAYVLQSSASNLYEFREQLLKGLSYTGPAVFSVYSGVGMGTLPPYLAAAAAMQSRAFPAFTYDPAAGNNLASRFSLMGNPQADHAWPVEDFLYEDADHQRITQDIAFTFVDFVACDPRYAKHFARVPRDKWSGSIAPAEDTLACDAKAGVEKVPSVWMVDGENRLHKVIVDQKVVSEARRCAETWHSLQELGGINNSHFERLLALEKQTWESQQRAAAPAAAPAAPAAPAAAPAAAPQAAAAPAAAPEAEPEKTSDEAYIETPRCTTCNECTNLNDRMFGYDANKQAFIKDLKAGTYRQLVEAAEGCQVSIIHPGKPWNTSEPGLDELIKRAEGFL